MSCYLDVDKVFRAEWRDEFYCDLLTHRLPGKLPVQPVRHRYVGPRRWQHHLPRGGLRIDG